MNITPKHEFPAEGTINGIATDEQGPRSRDADTEDASEGYLKVFQANEMESTHPDVKEEDGKKSIKATTTQGYLCQSPPVSGYPNKALEANFRVFIDNNTYDDAVILIVDVIDLAQDRVLQKMAVPRKAFPEAKAFNLLKLPFTPPENTQISLRVYYFGYAYVAVDKIALLDPSEATWDAEGESSQPGQESGGQPETERDAIIGAFKVTDLPSQHSDVFYHRGGKAIRATTKEGFLSYGPYVTGYPVKSLDVYFCLYIDNNKADNREILYLDVHDVFQKKILADQAVTRQQFPVAGQFTLFKLSFAPIEKSKLEFRIFYKGYAYIAANYIIVADPDKIQLESPADIPDDIFKPVRPLPRPESNRPQPPQPQPQPIQSEAILHLPQMTPEIVQQQQGRNHGGSFKNGTYTPSDGGGLEFVREVDFDKQFEIEFEIEGNIANSHLGEMNGGKVSLFTILQQNGPYYLGLQRMRYEYRGGGTLRVMVTHNYGSEHGAGFIITAPEISGHYTTLNWGNEPHRFKLLVKGNRCRLFIDDSYTSPWTWSTGGVRGKRRVSFMIGNRIPPMAKQHPITRYKWVKITTS